MQYRNHLCATIGVLALITSTASANMITFDVTITADNQYGLYTGDGTTANSYVGGEFATLAADIWDPETYNLTLDDDSYIYITSWSDLSVYQGLMAAFESDQATVLTGDPRWEVTATGINRANGAAPVPLVDLTTEIQNANAGTNPSNGWVPAFAGPLNDGSGVWNAVIGGGMPAEARWTWYNSGDDPRGNAPFLGFDHDEYLIFRIPVNVPEPAGFMLVALGAALIRRRF